METVIGSNYVLGNKIGKGAFGEIYEGIIIFIKTDRKKQAHRCASCDKISTLLPFCVVRIKMEQDFRKKPMRSVCSSCTKRGY